jgi:hypothetical protein
LLTITVRRVGGGVLVVMDRGFGSGGGCCYSITWS